MRRALCAGAVILWGALACWSPMSCGGKAVVDPVADAGATGTGSTSTSSTTATSTGTGTGTGTGTATGTTTTTTSSVSCDQGDCWDCVNGDCAGGNCPTELDACVANQQCLDLNVCWHECWYGGCEQAPDPKTCYLACQSDCDQQHPGGVDDLYPVWTCLCGSCLPSCLDWPRCPD